MNPLPLLRNHPMILASGLVMAFAGWLVYDARPDSPPPDVGTLQLTSITAPPPESPPESNVVTVREANLPGVVTQDLIMRLQPGMARVEVEGLIGVPPAGLVYPVSNVDGRFVYRASYLANLDAKRESIIPSPRSIIAIEFDASRPGHPLLKVHVNDPMS